MHLNKKLLSGLLLIVALILGSYIANRLPGQLDATEGNLYTLSPGSKSIVRELEEPVALNFYFSRSLEDLPIRLKNYATRVEDLLRQYRRASNGAITLKVIDPKPDTDQEEAAIRAGLNSQPVGTANLFFGLEAIQADNTAVISFFNFNREAYLEYDVSQLIHGVQQLDKPVLGILSSLPVEGSEPDPRNPFNQEAPDRWLFLGELERTYTVRSLDAESAIPGDLDLLVLLHPQDLGEERLYEVDQFLLSGRPVLALVDPVSYWQMSNTPPQQMMGMRMPETGSNLEDLFEAYGISFTAGELVADPASASQVTIQPGAPPVRYPIWLNLRNPASGHPATANLNDLLLPQCGAVSLAGDSGLTLTPLLQTSTEAGMVDAQTARFTAPDRIGGSITGERKARTIAAIIEGTFPTAFPDGRPEPPGEDGETGDAEPAATAEPEADESFLAQSVEGGSVLMVVGDTDFLANDFSVRVMNLLGMRSASPINDNLAFFFNAVDSLTGSPELVSLRGKGQLTRPFTVVEEMQRKAQAEYQEQLTQLEERLREVQQELRQLQQQQTDSGILIASPETREAIEAFRLEEAEVRSQQREIRKKLREDVEALNLRLALINLLAVPLLVSAGGVVFFWKRNRK